MSRERFMPSLWVLYGYWWWRARQEGGWRALKTARDCRVESVCWWLAGYPWMGRRMWAVADDYNLYRPVPQPLGSNGPPPPNRPVRRAGIWQGSANPGTLCGMSDSTQAGPTRAERLAAQSARFNEWARTATTDIVPDVFAGESMPDGTVATQPMWFDAENQLQDHPPAS